MVYPKGLIIFSESLGYFSLFLLFIGIYFNDHELMYFSATFMLLGLIGMVCAYLVSIKDKLDDVYLLLKEKRGIV